MGRRCQHDHHFLNDIPELERHSVQDQFAGFDLGEIQNVVNDGQQDFRGFADGVQVVALLAGQWAFQQQLGEADDAVQWRPDFMGHVGQELGFDPARFQCFLAGKVQFDILDFNGLQGLPQVLGGLVNVLLHFGLGLAQFRGHIIEPRLQLFELRAGTGVNPGVELAFLEFGYGFVELEYRVGEGTAQPQRDGKTEQDTTDHQQQRDQQRLVGFLFRADVGHLYGNPAQRGLAFRRRLAGVRVQHGLDHQILKVNRRDKTSAAVVGHPDRLVGFQRCHRHGFSAAWASMKHALAIAAIEGDGANILFFKKGVGEAAQQAAIGREQAVFRACGKLSGQGLSAILQQVLNVVHPAVGKE